VVEETTEIFKEIVAWVVGCFIGISCDCGAALTSLASSCIKYTRELRMPIAPVRSLTSNLLVP